MENLFRFTRERIIELLKLDMIERRGLDIDMEKHPHFYINASIPETITIEKISSFDDSFSNTIVQTSRIDLYTYNVTEILKIIIKSIDPSLDIRHFKYHITSEKLHTEIKTNLFELLNATNDIPVSRCRNETIIKWAILYKQPLRVFYETCSYVLFPTNIDGISFRGYSYAFMDSKKQCVRQDITQIRTFYKNIVSINFVYGNALFIKTDLNYKLFMKNKTELNVDVIDRLFNYIDNTELINICCYKKYKKNEFVLYTGTIQAIFDNSQLLVLVYSRFQDGELEVDNKDGYLMVFDYKNIHSIDKFEN